MSLLTQRNTGQFRFNSLTDLRALSGENLKAGEIVFLSSATPSAEGSERMYAWNASSTDTDDGDLTIKLTDTDTGRLKLYGAFLQSGTGAAPRTLLAKVRESVSVLDFGANETPGTTDMTPAIQRALDAVDAAGGGTVRFPAAAYLVESPGDDDLADYPVLDIPSDTRLVFEPGVTIQLGTTGSGRYKLFNIKGVSNVVIEGNGATIQCDRAGPLAAGSVGEWGHGVNIEGSDKVRISNLRVTNAYGDGFYVGAGAQGWSEDVEIRNCSAYNCRRQGLSIISVKGFADYNGLYEGTTGTSPSAGVDIEPDAATEYLENIRFYGTRAKDCDGTGFFVYLDNLRENTRNIDIEFRGCRTEGCNADGANVGGQYAAFEVRRGRDAGGVEIPEGVVRFVDCVSVDDQHSGFAVSDKSSSAPRVQIIRPVVINPNQAAATAPSSAAGIRVYASGATYTTSPGGVDIVDPTVVDRDGNLNNAALAAIYLGDAPGAPATDVHVRNPRITLSAGSAGRKLQATNNGGVWYVENGNPPEEAYTTGTTVLNRHVGSILTNEGQVGGTVTMTLGTNAQIGIGAEVEFMVKAAQNFQVDPNASEEIVPSGSGVGKYAQSSTIGSRLRLRRISSTQWAVLSEVGTWTWEA